MRASEAVSKANSERGQISTFLETKKVEMITETSSSESEFNVEEIYNETAEKKQNPTFSEFEKDGKIPTKNTRSRYDKVCQNYIWLQSWQKLPKPREGRFVGNQQNG